VATRKKKTEKEIVLPAKVRKEISNKFFTAVNEQKAKVRETNKKMVKMAALLKECAKEIKTLRKAKITKVEKKVNLFESKMVDKISRFLDYKIDSAMPKSLVEEAAKVQVLEPLFEDVKRVFAKSNIKLDEKGVGILGKAKTEIESLREQVNTEMGKRMKLEEASERLLGKVYLDGKCNGLTDNQTSRIKKIFEGSSYDEIKSKFRGVRDTILEGEFSAQKKKVKSKLKGIKTSVRRKKVKTISEGSDLEDAWGRLVD